MTDNLGVEIDLKEIKSFTDYLRDCCGYDFSDYALSSFKRRLQRLISIFGVFTLDQIITKIKQNPAFVEKVVHEITVNTTEMFRDPSFWVKLRDKVIPEILKVSNGKIKIWHMACSSGEEVFSMCILLKEMGAWSNAVIRATDINEEVINAARSGVYHKRNLSTNNSNYKSFTNLPNADLSKYYSEYDQDNIIMDTSLLGNVTFAKYDLVKGQATSKFDLIICRNVLIYFNMNLQDSVVSLVEKSLFSGGYFAIGSRETIAWCKSSGNFKTIDPEDKIYKKLG